MNDPRMSRRLFHGLVGGRALTAAGVAAAEPAAARGDAAGEGATDERPFRSRSGSASGHRPNVLVILGDDLGWADLSSYGAPHIKTPHLDSLARQGVRFTNAYSGS